MSAGRGRHQAGLSRFHFPPPPAPHPIRQGSVCQRPLGAKLTASTPTSHWAWSGTGPRGWGAAGTPSSRAHGEVVPESSGGRSFPGPHSPAPSTQEAAKGKGKSFICKRRPRGRAREGKEVPKSAGKNLNSPSLKQPAAPAWQSLGDPLCMQLQGPRPRTGSGGGGGAARTGPSSHEVCARGGGALRIPSCPPATPRQDGAAAARGPQQRARGPHGRRAEWRGARDREPEWELAKGTLALLP